LPCSGILNSILLIYNTRDCNLQALKKPSEEGFVRN